MDWFVCGNFASITCGTWIAFWNGAIGAFVAAIVGGFVALVVVRLTNAQQRHGVERTVEVAAIADFVAALEELEWSARYRMGDPQEFDAGQHILLMRSAIARLQMARAESKEVADILMLWPEKLHNLVIVYRVSRMRKMTNSREILEAIASIATYVTTALPLTVSRSARERAVGFVKLKEADQKIKAAMERFEKELLDQFPDAPVAPKRPTG